MRALRVLSVVAGLVAVVLPAPARAALVADGLLCNRAQGVDPGVPEYHDETVYAGPLTLVDDASGPVTATVVCTVRNGWHHADPALVSVESGPGTGVVVLPPTTVTYPAAGFTVLCTELRIVAGPTLYYDAYADAWTTDPSTSCEFWGEKPPEPFVLDRFLCPLLTEVFPPEGDIPSVWDCPPYGDV